MVNFHEEIAPFPGLRSTFKFVIVDENFIGAIAMIQNGSF